MLKEKYKHMSDQISPDPELVENMICMAREAKTPTEKEKCRKKHTWRRPAILLAAVTICIFAGVPALAASVPQIYELMYLVSPSVAQFFMPVERSCEDNGIKMEVVSAFIHENTAEIYVTMQDLAGNRVDETTDLFDSYAINRPFDSVSHCERVGYDPQTRTATFLITISDWGNQDITGDKITFSVSEFISDKQYFEDMKIPVTLGQVQDAEASQNVFLLGSGGNYEAYVEDQTRADVLIPSRPMEQFPVEGIYMTGIGYLKGLLHIQIAVPNSLQNDNHGYFYLKDASGNEINCDYNVYFSENLDADDGDRTDYCDFVFNIPKENLSEYELYGNFVTSGMLTEGNWRVTFPLERD